MFREARIILTQRFSKFQVHQSHLEGWKNHLLLDSSISDSVGLGWDPKIFTSNKLPCDGDVTGVRITF